MHESGGGTIYFLSKIDLESFIFFELPNGNLSLLIYMLFRSLFFLLIIPNG